MCRWSMSCKIDDKDLSISHQPKTMIKSLKEPKLKKIKRLQICNFF